MVLFNLAIETVQNFCYKMQQILYFLLDKIYFLNTTGRVVVLYNSLTLFLSSNSIITLIFEIGSDSKSACKWFWQPIKILSPVHH